MKTILCVTLVSIGLFGGSAAMATSTVALGKTAKSAVRAELKIAYPKTKFGAISLATDPVDSAGITKNWSATAKFKPGLFTTPIQANGQVFSVQKGSWRATLGGTP